MEKTLAVHLAELREQIARQIEATKCSGGICYGVNGEHCDVVQQCADITRGQK